VSSNSSYAFIAKAKLRDLGGFHADRPVLPPHISGLARCDDVHGDAEKATPVPSPTTNWGTGVAALQHGFGSRMRSPRR